MAIPPSETFAGRLIIVWPKPGGPAVHGNLVAFIDADSGDPIVTITDLTVHVDLYAPAVAEVAMYADADGKPLLGAHAMPVRAADGKAYRTGTFRWLVAEMRVAT
jgi:hypothetical protein